MDKTSEMIKEALRHSIAQTFLIFSGILIVVAVWHAQKETSDYVLVSFLTLIFAFANHKIEALRHHESLGRYAVGSYYRQAVLFTVISFLYFLTWLFSVLYVLCYPFSSKGMGDTSSVLFFLSIVLTFIWICQMFSLKKDAEKNIGKSYSLLKEVVCRNCSFVYPVEHSKKEDQKTFNFNTGKPIGDHPCKNCGVYELQIKDTQNKQNVILKQEFSIPCKTQDE